MKHPFVSKDQLVAIAEQYPTPFHLYDEAGIRANARAVLDAFSWNPGFREYFAVKANPNPSLVRILAEYGCGCDCSSYTELMIARALGITGEKIMFSSNDTPAEDFALARELGAIVNFDDISHIPFFEEVAGPVPATVSCRFNPGGLFRLANGIMDNPGDSKYGMTEPQLFEACTRFSPPTRTATTTTRPSRGSCLSWPCASRASAACTWALSTSPAAWASRTGRTRPPATYAPSARACAAPTRRCSCRRGWATSPSTPRWAAS